MSKYTLRASAKSDLKEIGRYTQKEWGIAQRDKYLRQLESRFLSLAKTPRMGRSRNDVKTDYFSFQENAHVIFYLIKKDHIEILAIIHQRMEPTLHL